MLVGATVDCHIPTYMNQMHCQSPVGAMSNLKGPETAIYVICRRISTSQLEWLLTTSYRIGTTENDAKHKTT